MSENIKVFELAKELNLKALELLDKIKPLDLKLKNHMADLSAEQVEQIRSFLNPPESTAATQGKRKVIIRKNVEPTTKASALIVKRKPTSSTLFVKKESDSAVAESGENRSGLDVHASENATSNQDLAPQDSLAADHLVASDQGSDIARDQLIINENSLSSSEIQTQSVSPAEQSVGNESAQSTKLETSTVTTAGAPNESGAASALPETPAAPAVPVRRGPRYSIIRVVSPEEPKPRKPLIVEDAPANMGRKGQTSAPKTFVDPSLSRSATALIREAEEESYKKKQAPAPRVKEGEQNFKSTDFLRRERVYQPKKKRISIGGRTQSRTQVTQAAAHKRMVDFEEEISVESLARDMSVKAVQVAQKLHQMNVETPDEADGFSDWYLDMTTAQLVAAEFGFEVKDVSFKEEEITGASEEDVGAKPRAPVITIMGHVDHGKTSLLDIIRRARVAAGEAGGITQHIGAYSVSVKEAVANLAAHSTEAEGKRDRSKTAKGGKGLKKSNEAIGDMLTFLDTPGHAAFTAMRSRGAQVTDIVVLVVSAADGVMPQTREAVEHAKAAGVPLIVAVNKMDLPEANPDRIKQQLSELGLQPEEWGGETIYVPVSAKTGLGIDKLLEMIQLQAEVLELKARDDGPAEASVIEAKLDKGRGPVASILVLKGQLAVGQYIVVGEQYGKVRAIINDKGQSVREAGPSLPVEILGLGGVPDAGDPANVVADEKAARALVEHRILQKREESAGRKGLTAEDLFLRMAQGDLKELPVILKADVKGSVEAIQGALAKLPTNKIRLKILSAAVGGITESDVLLASASKAVIFGFNVRPDNKGQAEAERLKVQVKTYTIIYDLLEDVRASMEGLLSPQSKELVMGRAEVREVFSLSKSGAVAGCSVVKGKVQRANQVRLIRDGRVVYTGKMSGLRRFKDDAKEVAEGFECGISLENFSDIKQGDIIEAYTIEHSAARLDDSSPAQA